MGKLCRFHQTFLLSMMVRSIRSASCSANEKSSDRESVISSLPHQTLRLRSALSSVFDVPAESDAHCSCVSLRGIRCLSGHALNRLRIRGGHINGSRFLLLNHEWRGHARLRALPEYENLAFMPKGF